MDPWSEYGVSDFWSNNLINIGTSDSLGYIQLTSALHFRLSLKEHIHPLPLGISQSFQHGVCPQLNAGRLPFTVSSMLQVQMFFRRLVPNLMQYITIPFAWPTRAQITTYGELFNYQWRIIDEDNSCSVTSTSTRSCAFCSSRAAWGSSWMMPVNRLIKRKISSVLVAAASVRASKAAGCTRANHARSICHSVFRERRHE